MFLSIGKFLFHFSLQRYYFLPIPARKQAFILFMFIFVSFLFRNFMGAQAAPGMLQTPLCSYALCLFFLNYHKFGCIITQN